MENNNHVLEIVNRFAAICGSSTPQYKLIRRGGEDFLEIYVSKITDSITDKISTVKTELSLKNPLAQSVYLVERNVDNWLTRMSASAEYFIFINSTSEIAL